MGKALVIKGADFSANALAQITVISDDVRALFDGHNVGERGISAFQRFINRIGGLNGTLWGRIGKMYVPMLFESNTTPGDTFFDVKNNAVYSGINPAYATMTFSNRCLTITTTPERTTAYNIQVGTQESLSSIFGVIDSNFLEVGGNINFKTGYTPRWNRGGGIQWEFTPGKTIAFGNNQIKIGTFGDALNNADISHGFIRSDDAVGYETPNISGSNVNSRYTFLGIDPSGASIFVMIFGYFTTGLTETEVKTVTNALYQLYLDMSD